MMSLSTCHSFFYKCWCVSTNVNATWVHVIDAKIFPFFYRPFIISFALALYTLTLDVQLISFCHIPFRTMVHFRGNIHHTKRHLIILGDNNQSTRSGINLLIEESKAGNIRNKWPDLHGSPFLPDWYVGRPLDSTSTSKVCFLKFPIHNQGANSNPS